MTFPAVSAGSAVFNLDRGQPVRVIPVTPRLSLAAVPWQQLSMIVPDPRTAEDMKALQYASAVDRSQAEMRNQVQRMIQGTKKAENAASYARYIANGMRGLYGAGWATPPFALWIPNTLEFVSRPGPFGDDFVAFLPFGLKGVLVDAETQHLAHVLLAENPETYGLSAERVNSRMVGVEIYHGIDITEARQIFHDRNLLGIIPNKTVALNSDSRDVATGLAHSVMDGIVVQHPVTRAYTALRTVVSVNKRQLGARDIEWMTLSTLRSFVVTLLFGRSGFDLASSAVTPDDLPIRANGRKVTPGEATDECVEIARVLFDTVGHEFARRAETVIASPAVLAALGAVGHRSLSWSPIPRRSQLEYSGLLKEVTWDRDSAVWDGIAGKTTASGQLSLAGGVKDNGSKTATALEDVTSPMYAKIRRKAAE